jgi:hypothetical protein
MKNFYKIMKWNKQKDLFEIQCYFNGTETQVNDYCDELQAQYETEINYYKLSVVDGDKI